MDQGSWAVDTMPTRDWGLKVHYVTSAQARAEVEAAGFSLETIVSRDGQAMTGDDPQTMSAWFYVVARHPPSDHISQR